MKEYIQELERKLKREKRLFIADILRKWKAPFKVQRFKALPSDGENFIIDYPDTDSTLNKKKVLLTAHYDTFFGVPGANDNASGVSVLLEMVKRIAQQKPSVMQPVRIVLSDLEERILAGVGAGCRAYIKEFGIEDIEKVYNLEMVGMGEILLPWPATEHDSEDGWLTPLAKRAHETGFEIITMPYPRVTLLSFPKKLGFASDHVPFIEKRHKRAVSLTVIPREDMGRLHEVLEGRRAKRLVWDLVKHHFFKTGRTPKLLRHYHNKHDTSEFVEENTLQKIFEIVWKTTFEEL